MFRQYYDTCGHEHWPEKKSLNELLAKASQNRLTALHKVHNTDLAIIIYFPYGQ